MPREAFPVMPCISRSGGALLTRKVSVEPSLTLKRQYFTRLNRRSPSGPYSRSIFRECCTTRS